MVEYEMKRYKQKQEWRIIPKGEFGIKRKCPSNLKKNEHEIIRLEAKNCPKNTSRSCINLDSEISVVCEHFRFGEFPALMHQPVNMSHLYIICVYDKEKTEKEK